MTAPATLGVVYCTDEDIVVQAGADFASLSAKGPQLAYGTDGYFDEGSPWVLVSPSVDFAAHGVGSNMVVRVDKGAPAFRGGGELLAVDSATIDSLTLRWPGLASGVGRPPGYGAVTGVRFEVRTLIPQIEDASYELNERFGIDPMQAVRAPSGLYDPRGLRRPCVLLVLYRAYLDEMRAGTGDWTAKVARYQADLDDALDRAAVRWGPTGRDQPPTGRFSTRVSR